VISIPLHVERCDSGTHRKRFREVNIILINQLLTLKDERELERAHPQSVTPLTPSNISVSPATVPICLMSGSLRTLFLSGWRLRSYETGRLVREDVLIHVRVPPTSSFVGVGTCRFGRSGLAFLANHLWKDDTGIDKTNNGLETITPDRSLTVSGEGGPVVLVTKPRTFPPPWTTRKGSVSRKTPRERAKHQPWNVPSRM